MHEFTGLKHMKCKTHLKPNSKQVKILRKLKNHNVRLLFLTHKELRNNCGVQSIFLYKKLYKRPRHTDENV